MAVIKISLLYFIQVIELLIMVRILLSWIARGRHNQFTQFIYQITEPLLFPLREIQYKIGINGPLDFSPIFLFLILSMVRSLIITIF